MPDSFGARLRQRREERGIALSTIAEKTKIKPSLLEALERDDVSQWPSGFYRRALIRAYARAIGLDPDAVVRECLEVHPEPPDVDVLVAMAATVDRTQGTARPASGIRTVVSSAIASLSRIRRSPSVGDPSVHDAAANQAPTAVTREPAPPSSEPDLLALARLCTEFCRVADRGQLQPLLQEAARILDANGLIVWLWDSSLEELKPALVHGYTDKVIAQLPSVRRDADNATAAAFRTARTCAISESHDARGALVVPLLTPDGCAGVLAIELQRGREQTESVRAIAMILAASLAQLTGNVQPAEAHRALYRGYHSQP
jgi:transcriptional regulator with XRE-family HTH domain